MVPLLFIIIVVTALSLLIYWVLANINPTENISPKTNRFHYELAQELSTYGESDLFVPQNSIKFSGNDAKNMLAYWNLSPAKFEEECRHNQVRPDPELVVLRIYEVNEWRTYYDIKVKSISGKCRFELQPGNYYYLELGIRNRDKFISFLTSNTVRLSPPSPAGKA
jgi:hypothetical protein